MKNKKEKGQDLVEFALILALVSIFIIGILLFFAPYLDYFKFNGNKGALASAPIIYESDNPVYLPPNSYFAHFISVDYGICEIINTGPFYLRVGTPYEDTSFVVVTKEGSSSYKICNNLRGTSIEVVYAFYRLEK